MLQVYIWDAEPPTDLGSNEDKDGASFRFPRLLSYDPSCLAAIAYLKLLEIPFTLFPYNNPSLSKTHALPVTLVNNKNLIHGLDALFLDEPLQPPITCSVKSYPQCSEQEKADGLILFSLLTGPILDRLIQERCSNLVPPYQPPSLFTFYFSYPLPRQWLHANDVRIHAKQLDTKPRIPIEASLEWVKSKLHPYFHGPTPGALDALAFGFLAPLAAHLDPPLVQYLLDLYHRLDISTFSDPPLSPPRFAFPKINYLPWLRGLTQVFIGLGLWFGYHTFLHQPQERKLVNAISQLTAQQKSGSKSN